MVLLLYSGAELWLLRLGEDNPATAAFCDAWLCPLELSSSRVYELQQENLSGPAEAARAEFEEALRLNPASAYAWADLGEAMLNNSRTEFASYCFERAVAAGPNLPSILMRAANAAFVVGDGRRTMYYTSRILRNPALAQYYNPVFLTYTRMNLPLDQILALGIPQNPSATASFLRFLIGREQIADAEATWQWISHHSLEDSSLTGEYIRFLIDHNKEQSAAETWYLRNRVDFPEYRQKNWVFDGSFEAAPKPSPLDWHVTSTEDVHVSRFQGAAHKGAWSIQLLFMGQKNVDYRQVFQQTILSRGKWRARAFVRTQGLTTDQGLYLRIYDPRKPTRLDVSTENVTGTHDWTMLEKSFEVGPQTSLIQVEIARQASQKIDNRIAGIAWVDSVELTPEQ